LIKIILVFSFVISATALADNAPVSNPALSLHQTMAEIGDAMVDIFPLIYAKRELGKEEQKKFGQDLTRMVGLFQAFGSSMDQMSGTYQVSYQYVMKHMNDTKNAYDTGDIEKARSQLYALGAICSSCHVQDTKYRTIFKVTSRKRFDDDFSYAELNYVTRNYSEALKYYDKYLTSKTLSTEMDIIQPLQRLIIIYTQIYGTPDEGAKQLKKYLAIKKHTPETKSHLKKWIDGLKILVSKGARKYQDIDFKAVENYVKQYLGPLDEITAVSEVTPEEVVVRVWLRGLLYHYLGSNPSKDEVPKLLYWLSICDRSIDFNFYFSLADLYLRDCILNHSEHPYAKRCFDEYNAYVIFSYTGSAGTYIPSEIQRELDQLQSAIR